MTVRIRANHDLLRTSIDTRASAHQIRGVLSRLARFWHLTMVRPRWRRLSLEQVARRFRTPDQVHRFMQIAFEYVRDDEAYELHEHWKLPGDTLRDHFGDCEDWSLFASEVLERNGYDTHIFCVFRGSEGHAVCVYEEHGELHSVCNEAHRRRLAPAGCLEEVETARRLAAALFPAGWTSCSWVRALRRLEVARRGVPRGFHPEYRWIEP